MTLEQLIKQYQEQYTVLDVINLDDWYSFNAQEQQQWLYDCVKRLHKPVYEPQERIIFTLSRGDEYRYVSDRAGVILTALQELLNQIDISNFFVVVMTVNPVLTEPAREYLSQHSSDSVPITFEYFDGEITDQKTVIENKQKLGYNYNSSRPIKIAVEDLTERQKDLLLHNQQFCMYPWMHLYVEPSGRVSPCCGIAYSSSLRYGNTNKNSLREIWNDAPMRELRLNMLNGVPTSTCNRCYEQEAAGFFSMRNSANKHHGHHIARVDATEADGTVSDFSMLYWDVRFSNLCNLRCRSCGPSFSSSWYQDQLAIAPDYKNHHKALIFAGKYETDLWEQLLEHIDYVEQVYFAGGEPMMMDEHYRILEELVRRKRFDVRLIYNTNFTQIRLRDCTVFDYWKKFHSVSVGASLDGSHERGEYIRKGTDWAEVEQNRRLMQEICPDVDFYVSATLSIMNAWHLPDFHRDWVERGFIHAHDFNVNILTDPVHYRLDIAREDFKKEIEKKYQQHLAWLSPRDPLRRASNGYQSAINFMWATDNSNLIPRFWEKTIQLDQVRNENVIDALPELTNL